MEPESKSSSSGVIGPDVTHLCGSDENIKGLYDQLTQKKVLTEEIWQELVNPLIPAEGIAEEDIEFFQFHEQKRLLKESGGTVDLKTVDRGRFKRARSEVVYSEQQKYTISLAKPKDPLPASKVNPIARLRRIVKVHKPAQPAVPPAQSQQEPIEKRLKLAPDFE